MKTWRSNVSPNLVDSFLDNNSYIYTALEVMDL